MQYLRYPPIPNHISQNNLISLLCSNLSLTDAWCFFIVTTEQFTWCNSWLSLKSRIDLVWISSSSLQYVKHINHLHAPLHDYKLISLKLSANQKPFGTRGYWKFNNYFLKYVSFNNTIKIPVKEILHDGLTENYRN